MNLIIRFINVVAIFAYGLALLIAIVFSFSDFWGALIFLLIGFAVVDGLKIAALYVLNGSIDLNSSILVKCYLMIFSSDGSSQKQNSEENFDEKFKLLLKIEDKNQIMKFFMLQKDTKIAISQKEQELNKFYAEMGKDEEFFKERDNLMKLSAEELDRYHKLRQDYDEFRLYDMTLEDYFSSLEKIDMQLQEGLGIKEAKKKLEKLHARDADKLNKVKVDLEFIKAIEEEVVEAKKKHGDDIGNVKFDIEKVTERVYKNNPDWKTK